MASRSLGTLTLDLVARIGGFEQGMDRASKISEKRLKQIATQASALGNTLGNYLTRGIDLVTKSFTDLFKAGANFQDISEKIGDSAQAVASLKAAADVSETSFDDIAAASIKLTANLAKTDDEAKGVGKALAAIGISLDEFKKLSPVEQIDAIAQGLAKFENGAGKTAVAVTLLGKSGASMLPFLNDLADGAERQISLTQEQIDAANELAETFAALKGQGNTLALQLAGEVTPAVLELVKAFSDVIKEVKLVGGDNSIKEWAQGAAVAFATTIEFIVRTIRTLNTMRLSIQAVFADLRVLNKAAGLLTPLAGFDIARGGLSGEFKELLADRNTSVAAANKSLEDLLNTNTTAVSDALRKTFDEQRNYVEKVDGLKKPELKFSGIPPETEKNAKKAAKAIDEYSISLESARAIQEEVERLQGEQNKLLNEAASIYDATRTPLEKFNAEIERLNRLRDTFVNGKPLIDDVTYRRAVVAAQDDLTNLGDKTKEVTDEMSVYAEQAARNMQDAFADFLFDPFDQGLKGLLQSFAQTLQRMAAEAAAAQIFKGISAGSTGSGGLWDVLLGIGGSLGGSQSYGGARAMGGPVMPGKAYLVGENGPEMFSPNGAGSIIPNGGGMTVNQSFMIQAPSGAVSKATQMQVGAAAARGAARASGRNN